MRVHAAALGGRPALHADDAAGRLPQEAKEILQRTDRIIATFPEVERVFGKVGRAETATDPAPLSMIETTIILKPEDRVARRRDRASADAEMDAAIQLPRRHQRLDDAHQDADRHARHGHQDARRHQDRRAGPEGPGAPRRARSRRPSQALPGTRSAYAERVMGGIFLDVEVDRPAAARYGLTSGDVQDVLRRPSAA